MKEVNALLQSTNNIAADYFQWLCEKIHVDTPVRSYWILAKILHAKEYYGTVPNDDNRANDGKKLREQYSEENDQCPFEPIDGPCTMLEMLIALAERFEDTMSDPNEHNRTTKWFWEMLRNLGLDTYEDINYGDLWTTEDVDEILNTVLERTYRRSGKGGLFPLKDAKKDQRKVEIWYQMCAYMLENYYVEDSDT
jgi:hypothetical protein